MSDFEARMKNRVKEAINQIARDEGIHPSQVIPRALRGLELVRQMRASDNVALVLGQTAEQKD